MSSRVEDIYIPGEDSPCQAWKIYFDRLKKEYGTANAREAWLYTWSKKGNSSCTKSKEFNSWAEENKVTVAGGVDKAIAGVSGIAQNVIGGISSLTGLTPKLTSAVLIGGVGLALFLLYRIARETKPSDVMNMIPSARLGKLSRRVKR